MEQIAAEEGVFACIVRVRRLALVHTFADHHQKRAGIRCYKQTSDGVLALEAALHTLHRQTWAAAWLASS
jgi:hypothetical protein